MQKSLDMLEEARLSLAAKMGPTLEPIIQTVAAEGIEQEKLHEASVRCAAALLLTLNVGINNQVTMYQLWIDVNPDPQEEDYSCMEKFPKIICLLPMVVSKSAPQVGDGLFLDNRIPPEYHPTIVSRTHFPYSGGHTMIGLKLFVNTEEDVQKAWSLFEKYMGATQKEVKDGAAPEAG